MIRSFGNDDTAKKQTMLESKITTNETLPNIHPGEILKLEFLDQLNISCQHLANEINIPENRISELLTGTRPVDADMAIRLSKFFGTSPEFWLNLQNLYDLEEEETLKSVEFDAIKLYSHV